MSYEPLESSVSMKTEQQHATSGRSKHATSGRSKLPASLIPEVSQPLSLPSPLPSPQASPRASPPSMLPPLSLPQPPLLSLPPPLPLSSWAAASNQVRPADQHPSARIYCLLHAILSFLLLLQVGVLPALLSPASYEDPHAAWFAKNFGGGTTASHSQNPSGQPTKSEGSPAGAGTFCLSLAGF